MSMGLSSRMPDLGSFEVFLAVAETGSLGGAVRELGLTHQAVSRRLGCCDALSRVVGAHADGGGSPSW
jgi:hypothetical protein